MFPSLIYNSRPQVNLLPQFPTSVITRISPTEITIIKAGEKIDVFFSLQQF